MSVEEMQFWNDLLGQVLNFAQIVLLAYLAVLAKRVDDQVEEHPARRWDDH